tara:strand:- start:66 stop:470 length:405 start_codon:yes stop_codon:yes gene_type:complete
MQITKQKLKNIIQEELQNMLQEYGTPLRKAIFDAKLALQRKAKNVGAGSRVQPGYKPKKPTDDGGLKHTTLPDVSAMGGGAGPAGGLVKLAGKAAGSYADWKEMEGDELTDPQRRSSGDTKIVHVTNPKHAENI